MTEGQFKRYARYVGETDRYIRASNAFRELSLSEYTDGDSPEDYEYEHLDLLFITEEAKKGEPAVYYRIHRGSYKEGDEELFSKAVGGFDALLKWEEDIGRAFSEELGLEILVGSPA